MEEERTQDANQSELLVIALDKPGDPMASASVPQLPYTHSEDVSSVTPEEQLSAPHEPTQSQKQSQRHTKEASERILAVKRTPRALLRN